MSRKIHDLENFQLFFNLTSDFILVKEYGCMYGLMNGADSDNAVSIQKMVDQITFTLHFGDKRVNVQSLQLW